MDAALRKAAVVTIALLMPVLFVGNGLHLLMHDWFVRAEYARPGFPPDEFGMKTPERTRLAIVGLNSILPWNREGIDLLREARLDDGGVAFGGRRAAAHGATCAESLGVLLGLHAVTLVALVAPRRGAPDAPARAKRATGRSAGHARALRARSASCCS